MKKLLKPKVLALTWAMLLGGPVAYAQNLQADTETDDGSEPPDGTVYACF